ncbi:MAG: hypothetical protein CMJ48_12320 [Planctomycetaceae bacterium]|nr:hypothetical protein [Planctomycetaceae bacterium]
MPLLAQDDAFPLAAYYAAEEPSLFDSFAGLLCFSSISFVYLAYSAFWLWMFIECLRKDPDRYFWLWIFIFLWFPGPLIYFFLRWMPTNQIRAPRFLQRFTSSSKLQRLETAAEQIGNAHQFIELGDARLEISQFAPAGRAFARALEKEPDNLQALWGAARVDAQQEQFEPAREKLRKILDVDPQYKFGDVSLEYGKALGRLDLHDEARDHLEDHMNRWRHPEALYLLAAIYLEEGRRQDARAQLQAMLLDINGSPKAIARKFGIWKSRARKLLKTLPPSV